MTPILYSATIVDIIIATPTVKLFLLRCDHSDYRRLAGQWINVFHNNEGQFDSASFSVASSPTDAGMIELAIKYSARHSLTRWLHQQARLGDAVRISHGQGSFVYRQEMGKRVVLIGAGTGITPLISIARYIADNDLAVDTTLLYSVTSLDEYLYRTEIGRLSQSSRFHCLTTLTQPDAQWSGTTGRINEPLLQLAGIDTHTWYYLCGPQAMVDEISERLVALGTRPEQTIYEKWW